MSRWKPWIAVCLLALWGPATMHCALETAGIIEETTACCEETDCSNAVCCPLESGIIKPAPVAQAVPSPALVLLSCSLNAWVVAPRNLATVADFSAVGFARPQDWVARWSFEHRTALPARAPSIVRT